MLKTGRNAPRPPQVLFGELALSWFGPEAWKLKGSSSLVYLSLTCVSPARLLSVLGGGACFIYCPETLFNRMLLAVFYIQTSPPSNLVRGIGLVCSP